MLRQLILAAALVAVALAAKSYDGYKVYHLLPSVDQQSLLNQFDSQQGYDFWTRSRVPGAPTDIMVMPHLLDSFTDFLNKHNIIYQVLIEDVQMTVDAESMRQSRAPPVTGRSISFTKFNRYAEINDYLSELATSYPNLTSVETIGKSSEGRDVNIIKISSGGGGTRPIILIDAGIHAREWIAPAMALYIIQQLVEKSTNANLISQVDWHIIPVINVDGYEYTHTTERFWRKTRSQGSLTCLGVDGNRNFGFHWMEIGASAYPCDEDFAGKDAFSEPETAALRDYATSNAARIKMYLTFHSYGEYILYPWSYGPALPSDWETLDNLGQQANAAQAAAGGNYYTVGQSTLTLYATAGSSDDWMKGVANVSLSFTVELPGGGLLGFDPPASSIRTTVSQFFEAVRVFGNAVTTPLNSSPNSSP